MSGRTNAANCVPLLRRPEAVVNHTAPCLSATGTVGGGVQTGGAWPLPTPERSKPYSRSSCGAIFWHMNICMCHSPCGAECCSGSDASNFVAAGPELGWSGLVGAAALGHAKKMPKNSHEACTKDETGYERSVLCRAAGGHTWLCSKKTTIARQR